MKTFIETLESRVHLSYTPYTIGDALPGPRRYVLDLADRLDLRAQLAGSTIGSKLAALNKNKANFPWQFDNTLLDYMKSRQGPTYDFAPTDVGPIVNFVKNTTDPDQQQLHNTEVLGTTAPPPARVGVSPAKPVADKATNSESLLRKRVRYFTYNFLVGGQGYPKFTPVEKQSAPGLYIDWLTPRVFGRDDSATVASYLQRLPHLALTAIAYRFLGAAAYGDTIANTLYTWAGQAPAPSQDALLRLYKAPGASAYSTTIPASVPVLSSWAALDTGVRVYPLLTTYNLMLGAAAWTPELNTLFMSLIYQHGRVLGETAKAVYVNEASVYGVDANPLGRTDNNKSLQLSGALLTLARMFPEFAATRDTGSAPEHMGWKSAAKRLLKDAIPRNYRGKFNSYAPSGGASWRFDGFHKEQSPGYGQNMAETFINQLKLSQINGGANDPFLKDDPELRALLTGEYVVPTASGFADPAAAIPIATRVEALYQFVNPDGTAPPFGDAPRANLAGTFLRAQQVLPNDTYARNQEYTWPTTYPSLSDVFYLWKKNITAVAAQQTYGSQPLYNRAMRDTALPATITKENRPNSPAKYRSWLPGAGYYMLRSDKGTRDDVQLTFDTGLLGVPNYNQNSSTQAHTQLDLLSFELFGYGRPLIEDVGLLGLTGGRERNFIGTTVAHNSFTVDNYSHARMDGYFAVSGPDENKKGVSLTGFHYGYQKLDVDSDHPNGNGPALARTIWFDRDDTFLIVDWGHQTTAKTHSYKISFTLPKPPTHPDQIATSKAAPVSLRAAGDPSQGVFTEGASGNVFILPLKYRRNKKAQKVGFIAGAQDAASGAVTGPFVTAANFSGDPAPADRLTVTQTGAGANFVTLIHTYGGKKNKDQVVSSAIAEVLSQTASTVTVRVTKNGVAKDVLFTNPFAAGAAPALSRQPIPTRPITVPPRSTNPITGGYPDWLESTESAAPPDLNAGRFTWGTGDSIALSQVQPPKTMFSAVPITARELLDEEASLRSRDILY